jgi:hypothetical protein
LPGGSAAWRVGDTQHPYPTLSELVRWTADQVGKASRSAAEQALGVPVAVPAMLRALTIAGPYIGHARVLRSGETAASVAHGIMERKDV